MMHSKCTSPKQHSVKEQKKNSAAHPSYPSRNGMSCKTHLTIIFCNELRWFFTELRLQRPLSVMWGREESFGRLTGVEMDLLGLSRRYRFRHRQQAHRTATSLFPPSLPQQQTCWFCQQEHAPAKLINSSN